MPLYERTIKTILRGRAGVKTHAHKYNKSKPLTFFNTKISQKVLVIEKVALSLSQKQFGQGRFPEHKTNNKMTRVIFRKESDGTILAVFNEYADFNYNLTCYAHIGQHSACSLEYYRSTKPATAGEYQNLLNELKQIGYNDLKIAKRLNLRELNSVNWWDLSR